MAAPRTSNMTKVENFALFSRILVIVIQAIFNLLMPDHDAKVFLPPTEPPQNYLNSIVGFLLSGFRRWDGVYFVHIAEHGYTYENTLAFFPVFPLLVRLLANTALLPLQWCLHYHNVLLVSGAVLNLFVFVQSAKVLHQLASRLLGDPVLANKAVQLYCINPASIFFSAAYSETVYAFCTLSGLLKLEDGHFFSAAVYFGLSGGTRSNGLVNVGFILYRKFRDMLQGLGSVQRSRSTMLNYGNVFIAVGSILWFTLGPTVLYVAVSVAPFALYQYHAYRTFCNPNASPNDLPSQILNYGSSQRYKMPHAGPSPWCGDALPLSYGYVQKTHWGVGFLEYYEYKQIPNFLLALPIVMISLGVVVCYVARNPVLCLTLGCYQPPRDAGRYKKTDDLEEEGGEQYGVYCRRCFVHVVHLAGLLAFGLCFMHVQVLTRFLLSACPVIYFFLAAVTTRQEQRRPFARRRNPYSIFGGPGEGGGQPPAGERASGEEEEDGLASGALLEWDTGWVSKSIAVYFHMYFFVGIGAFANFLPWT